MLTRRSVWMTALGLVTAGSWQRSVWAQSDAARSQTGLRNRGTPTGRVGAASRTGVNHETDRTLDLVAPLRGIGLSSSDQPTLCYLLSGPISGPLRLIIALHGQPRPFADLPLQPPRQGTTLGTVHLREHNIRLTPNTLFVWSVTMLLDPRSPSHDLVASALIQYAPVDAGLDRTIHQAIYRQDYAQVAATGYWYDAVATAEEGQARDGGAALSRVLRELGLASQKGSG
jgi:hypothetical protein